MYISPDKPQKICHRKEDANLAGEVYFIEPKSQEAAGYPCL
jgi:hypothetical protein